ncbi:unnamed protein product [Gongylonema pulchrum]|uniref:Uncharacterized protein n=1 Tax=Gongylonema pulchrum TaxID=637853 RepID=A0A3P7NUR2_9BILA|nr:unnamed protein product [Gongylonema pulchrum]
MDELLRIVQKIVAWIGDINGLLDLPHFLALVDLFRGERQRAECATAVLSAFVRTNELASSEDFQLFQKEKRLISYYIIRSLDRFDLHSDPERALDFYVDARALLSNLDAVVAVRFLI